MYCEITIRHRRPIKPDDLKSAIQQSFGNGIPLNQAYARSAIYGVMPPPASIFAFDLARNCFVILRKVSNVRFSTYHLEGTDRTVSVDTMLHAVQEFSEQITAELRGKTLGSDCRVRSLTVQLFEDNGRETGMEGKPVTLGSVFKEKFAWREIAPAVTAFATALLLIWRGLNKEPKQAVFYSLLIVLVFALGDTVAGYWWGRDSMKWSLRQN